MMLETYQPDENAENRFMVRSALTTIELTFYRTGIPGYLPSRRDEGKKI